MPAGCKPSRSQKRNKRLRMNLNMPADASWPSAIVMAKGNGLEVPVVAARLLSSHIDLGHEDRDFSINNVNRRLPNLLAWLKKAKPTSFACRN